MTQENIPHRWFPRSDATPFFKAVAPALMAIEGAISYVSIRGIENLPKEGPVIVVSNHTVYLDAITCGAAVYRAGRQPYFVAGSEYFDMPVLGWFLRRIGARPAYRQGPKTKDSLVGFEQVLADGHALVIFPEGTFTRDPHLWPMKGRTGVARLHKKYPDIPIVPLAHWGNEQIMDCWTMKLKYRNFGPWATHVGVVFGKPIEFEPVSGTEYEQLEGITEQIITRLEELLVPLRRALPQGYPVTPRLRRWDRKVDGDPFAEIERQHKLRKKRIPSRFKRFLAKLPERLSR